MASPTELARQAQEHSEALETDFKLLKQLVDTHDLPAIRELLVRVEARLTAFEKFEAEIRRINVIDDRVAKLEKRADDADRLRERVVSLETTVAELKKKDEESGKRRWQFVYIAAGALFALVTSFAVQLVFYFLKK